MTKEQEDWLVAEVMDSMKMSETEERSARRYVKRAVDKILIYCNREDLPERLLSTAAQIAEDMLKADLVKTGEKEVARIHGITPMQVLLAFVLYKENVIAIPRSGKAEHVLQNLEAGKVHLTAEEYARLDAAFPAPRKKIYLDIV